MDEEILKKLNELDERLKKIENHYIKKSENICTKCECFHKDKIIDAGYLPEKIKKDGKIKDRMLIPNNCRRVIKKNNENCFQIFKGESDNLWETIN